MAERAAVQVQNVAVGYGERIVLRNVSFEIREGEIVALLGGSGCGKSTMLKAVIGLLPVREGEILIENESIVRATGEKKRSIMRRFGVAFQGGALFRSYTIGENIALPLEEYTDYSKEEIRLYIPAVVCICAIPMRPKLKRDQSSAMLGQSCAAGLLNDFENQLIRQVQQRPEKGRGAGVLFDVLIALQVKLAVDQCVEHVPVSSMMADDKCQQGAAQEAHQPACQLRFAVSVLQAREQI